jgi:transcriptional regulator with XRE-family HTH domain
VKTISIRAQVLTALQEYTQKELAERLGVSTRTIRRWKRGETEPGNPFVRLALRDEFRAERDRIRRINRRMRAPDPPEVEVPLFGDRRKLVEYDSHGRDTGERYDSDWINYNVTRLDRDELFGILKVLRDRNATVQIIFRVRKYEGGNRSLAPGSHAASGIFSLRGWTDSELWGGGPGFKGLSRYAGEGTHRLIYIAVLER